MDRRLIEVDFPIKEVSEESVREKNIRHGHISTLHVWWARRPLAASRATTYAALIPAPKNPDELRKKLEFIANLSKWENSLNSSLIENAKKEIINFFGGKPPKVLDCFAGGGAIPLEALRLGCETHALEYNPVAVLILKALLEYSQTGRSHKTKAEEGLQSVDYTLVKDIKKWSKWVLDEAKREIGRFYPHDPEGSIPVGYVWARTVRCQNPSCGVEIPLLRQCWLANKGDRKIALKMIINRTNKEIEFQVVKGKDIDIDPSQGTTRRATVLCPICGSVISSKDLRNLFQKKKTGERMIATVVAQPKNRGNLYRIATKEDLEVFREAEKYLEKKIEELRQRWEIMPVPDEPLTRIPITFGIINVWVYGINDGGRF